MRLFVAVWPPAAVVEAIRGAITGLASRPAVEGDLRWAPPGQWHVTLRFLGQVDVDEALSAFHSLARPDDGPVVAEVGPGTARFGRRVLHVPVVGLEGLADAVVIATRDVGRPPDGRPFAGHLTLARARARGGADLSGWCGAPVSGGWTVEELTLVASRTDRDGTHYEVVDRFGLRRFP